MAFEIQPSIDTTKARVAACGRLNRIVARLMVADVERLASIGEKILDERIENKQKRSRRRSTPVYSINPMDSD